MIKWKVYSNVDIDPKEFVKYLGPKIGKQHPFEDERISKCRKDRELDKESFLILCYTKTPRQFNNYKRNSENEIQTLTKKSFRQADKKNDSKAIEILKDGIDKHEGLKGVRVPVASYILTAYHPREYGTYDYRVKEVLKEIPEFEEPKHTSKDLEWYEKELEFLRKWRDEIDGIDECREVEYSLWCYHQIIEEKEKEFEYERYLSS